MSSNLLSVTQYAKEKNKPRRTIDYQVKQAGLDYVALKGNSKLYNKVDLDELYKKIGDTNRITIKNANGRNDAMHHSIRLKKAQADKEEARAKQELLKLKELQKKTIDKNEVHKIIKNLNKTIYNYFQNNKNVVTNDICHDAGISGDDKSKVSFVVNTAFENLLTQLAEQILDEVKK